MIKQYINYIYLIILLVFCRFLFWGGVGRLFVFFQLGLFCLLFIAFTVVFFRGIVVFVFLLRLLVLVYVFFAVLWCHRAFFFRFLVLLEEEVCSGFFSSLVACRGFRLRRGCHFRRSRFFLWGGFRIFAIAVFLRLSFLLLLWKGFLFHFYFYWVVFEGVFGRGIDRTFVLGLGLLGLFLFDGRMRIGNCSSSLLNQNRNWNQNLNRNFAVFWAFFTCFQYF